MKVPDAIKLPLAEKCGCLIEDSEGSCIADLDDNGFSPEDVQKARTTFLVQAANCYGELLKARVDGETDDLPENCSLCVHGYDMSVHQGAMVICPPQNHKLHTHDDWCTGFRRITQSEIEERTAAALGEPRSTE